MDWLFQFDPSRHDLVLKIDEGMTAEDFAMHQHRSEISQGDRVFFWQTGAGDNARLVAVAHANSQTYDRGPNPFGPNCVDIVCDYKVVPPLSRSEALADMRLASFGPFKGQSGTNIPIRDEASAEALGELLEGRLVPIVPRIAIVKTGWSDFYRGGPVVGRFDYLHGVDGPRQGHECYNFMPGPDGADYASAPGKAMPRPDVKTQWLIVFVAAYNGKGPLTFVGWYEDATFADEFIERPEYKLPEPFERDTTGGQFKFFLSSKKAFMIPLEKRTETISGIHLRRSAIAYVKGVGKDEEWRNALAARALELLARFTPMVGDSRSRTVAGFPMGSAKHRKQVENAALEKTKQYLKRKRYDAIEDRSPDNCGYDIFAFRKRDRSELHIEVKGTSLIGERFLISRNEHGHIKDPRWRLALVTEALSNPTLRVLDADEVQQQFTFEPMSWMVSAK